MQKRNRFAWREVQARHSWSSSGWQAEVTAPDFQLLTGTSWSYTLLTAWDSVWEISTSFCGFARPWPLGLFAQSAQAQQRRTLSGPRAAGRRRSCNPCDRLPESTRLNLAIGLPLRNQDGLHDAAPADLRSQQSPVSPLPDAGKQFTERFGPTEQDYQAVVDFAQAANGFPTTRDPSQSAKCCWTWTRACPTSRKPSM